MAGNEQVGFDLVKACKKPAAQGTAESDHRDRRAEGRRLIRRASEISIDAGADFIKTSTGRVPVNATPEAAAS